MPNSSANAGQTDGPGTPSENPAANPASETHDTSAGAVYMRFTEACRIYQEELQTIWGGDDSQQQAQKAYYTYLTALQRAWAPDSVDASDEAYQTAFQQGVVPEGTRQRLAEAERALVKDLQSIYAAEDLGQRFVQAYRTYVRAVQQHWVEVDAEVVEPALLQAISHSMMVAGRLAETSLAILGQRDQMSAYYKALTPA